MTLLHCARSLVHPQQLTQRTLLPSLTAHPKTRSNPPRRPLHSRRLRLSSNMSNPPFRLTKQHVQSAFAPLAETSDAAVRERFVTDYLVPDVVWKCAGKAHSLAGTRHNIKDHNEATFGRLGKKLRGPIEFTVTKIVVDAEREPDGWWCSVETMGRATRATGEPYDNEYLWLVRWNDDGRIVEIRAYFDTMLSELVLQGPDA